MSYVDHLFETIKRQEDELIVCESIGDHDETVLCENRLTVAYHQLEEYLDLIITSPVPVIAGE